MAPSQSHQFRRALLRWYDRHARRLPWRAVPGQPANPYHVLVSEAMLQQTQVATVIDYFNRFVAELPDLPALASAGEQSVLRLWQGLGYYRRARNLHRAAGVILHEHGGCIPSDVRTLLALPGVGRYTAGAIASIAFNRREPVVDGNVARVLARWFAIAEPIDVSRTRAQLWQLAGDLVSPGRPGDFNQALMELGATVCTPRQPRCEVCPVSRWCAARAGDCAESLPRTLPRRKPTAVSYHALVVHRRGRYLLECRPATGLWANLWQFPTAESLPSASPRMLTDWFYKRFGLRITSPATMGTFIHQTTHRTIDFTLWQATASSGRLKHKRSDARWCSAADVADLPVSTAQQRMAQLVDSVPEADALARAVKAGAGGRQR